MGIGGEKTKETEGEREQVRDSERVKYTKGNYYERTTSYRYIDRVNLLVVIGFFLYSITHW